MITKGNLKSLGFSSIDGVKYQDAYHFEYEFNIKSQELWNINDGWGEPTFLCKITDFEKLKEILALKP